MKQARARGWGRGARQEGSPEGKQPEGRGPARAPSPAAAAAAGGGERTRRKRRRRETAAAARALTEWFTPHIRTLSSGSLARKSFTFCATKCFFLVLVLLASTEDPRLPGVAMAAASVPSTAALPGRGPALSTRRPGEAAASHRRRPRRAAPRSARRRARPRSAR